MTSVLEDSYGELPPQFFSRIAPTPVAEPRLIKLNSVLADELGLSLDGLDASSLAAVFSGNQLLPGSHPLAMAYAGHQFGQFVPQLGDGRALLLGEVRCAGTRRDIQLKGSGRTPYSRGGDGRAALGPVLREYLVSEAMHALGIPATRALAAVLTGEMVIRESRVPGAILTRVAASHVRVGTFQYFAARGDVEATRVLADYVIARHYANAREADNPYLELLRCVIRRQASLVASWMSIGFIHGVMNTDNMAVLGETIDFGPCAFMDDYDPMQVFSSIDHRGRYAYGNQPAAAQWNLARFAETLLPLIDASGERAIELATAAVGEFDGHFAQHWLAGMRRKLGLFLGEATDDALVRRLLELMHASHCDFTLTFRRLCDTADRPDPDAAMAALFADPTAYLAWQGDWKHRLSREPQRAGERAASMRAANPWIIPRNHRIEAVIRAAVDRADFAPFEALSAALASPFEEQTEFAAYANPPEPKERVLQTYCGT